MENSLEHRNSKSGGSHDFDFLFGRWQVHHRRLKERLVGCEEWFEFEGSTVAQEILGGQGNVDDNSLDLPGSPYRAASLRCFDSNSGLWSIWWLDSRAPGRIDPPLVGSFATGDGTFFADDSWNGRSIRVRFLWKNTESQNPRWEQAFSVDGGASWETNWTMDFERAP